MNPATLDLLQRVRSLVGEVDDWFDTISEWYSNADLTRRLLEELRTEEEIELLSLSINDQGTFGSLTASVQGRQVCWRIPAELLRPGENSVQVALGCDAQSPLFLSATSARQDGRLANQIVDLTVPNPKPSACLDLARCSEARHQLRCWAVFPNGYLKFKLSLTHTDPVHFALHLPPGRTLPGAKWKTDRRRKLLDDLMERVKKLVKHKIGELEESWKEARSRGDGQATDLKSSINELRAYEHLHETQIAKALSGSSSQSLEQVIRETGRPDELLRQFMPAIPVMAPLVVKPIPEVVPATSPPPLPTRTPPRRRTFKAGQSSSVFGKVMFLAALGIATVAGVSAWQSGVVQIPAWLSLNTTPIVKIDSLENGQLIAAGREFQVAVTTQNSGSLLGNLDNIELKVTASGAVEDRPEPPRRFPAGEQEPPSQVFTFRAKERQVPAAEEKIVITAQLLQNGKPVGRPDTVTVTTGSAALDLVFSISPTTLKPKTEAQVTMTVLNAKPDTSVSFTVVGSDGFKGKATLSVGADADLSLADVFKTGQAGWKARADKLPAVGPDGIIRFAVPGALSPGVVDVIEATIDGTNIRRKVRYTF